MRRGLVRAVRGKTITGVAFSPVLPRQLSCVIDVNVTDRKILEIHRHGKLLSFRLSDGVDLLAHLGMSGRFVLRPFGQRHDHFSWELNGATHLTYNDFRRFGRLEFGSSERARNGLGPDALTTDFRGSVLAIRTRRPIKIVLMDQTIVAGRGNIYACEALFRARIDPRRAANTLNPDERTRLVRAIKEMLSQAIEHGGSTLRDYRGTEGQAGDFDAEFLTYGRAGQPCHRCGPTLAITKVTLDGRATYFCQGCQF